MKRTWKEAVRLEFKGARFQDHALDLAALAELAQFQKMVAETAKALWRAANPNRERLPQHFEERTRLCLRRMDPGSAIVPLDVLIEDGDRGQTGSPPEAAEPAEAKELRDAIALSQEVFDALDRDAALPERFPKELVAEYAELGQTLVAEENIEFCAPGKRPTRVTSTHRERLARLADELAVQATGQMPFDPSARPIEDVLAEIAAQVPDEEWEKLPRDLSENHDHYLYGSPKR